MAKTTKKTSSPKGPGLGGPKTCNVPDCANTQIFGRGLCSLHYGRLKASNPDLREEAMRHMDPPKRSKGKKAKQATKATKANAGRQKPMPSRGGRAVKGPPPEPRMTVAEHQEDLTATCCELATALGCKTVETGPSRYFINPENGRIVELAANGLLFEAELARKARA